MKVIVFFVVVVDFQVYSSRMRYDSWKVQNRGVRSVVGILHTREEQGKMSTLLTQLLSNSLERFQDEFKEVC